MNFFCRIFGHTWWPVIDAPEPRWNNTKEGDVLVATVDPEGVRHYEVCKRCGDQRGLEPRRHDGDGFAAPLDSEESEEPKEAAES